MGKVGTIVALIGPQGGGKRAIARITLQEIPRARMITHLTTLPEHESDLPNEYERTSPGLFQRQESLGELLSPGWDAGNRVGTKKSSILEILATEDAIGLIILKPGETKPSRLLELRDLLLKEGVNLRESLTLVFVNTPPTLLEERLSHKQDPRAELNRRKEGNKQPWGRAPGY